MADELAGEMRRLCYTAQAVTHTWRGHSLPLALAGCGISASYGVTECLGVPPPHRLLSAEPLQILKTAPKAEDATA